MNGYGKLRRCTDRDGRIVDFYLYLARAAFVTVRDSSATPEPATAGPPAPPPAASSEPIDGRSY